MILTSYSWSQDLSNELFVAHSNAWVMGSNPICLFFCVSGALCVGRGNFRRYDSRQRSPTECVHVYETERTARA
jgi:hypothetical protein